MTSIPREENRQVAVFGVSSVDGTTPVSIYVNPSTHRMLATLDVSDITAINGLTNAQLVDAAHKGFMALGSDGTNYRTLAVDASGNLQVDILNASLAVTGTFWQATQPVSLASVPSHAVTNAGTFAVQVDGVALTALQLIDDIVYAEDTGHTTADKGAFILGVRNDSDVTLTTTDLDYSPIAVTASGKVVTATNGMIAHDTVDSVNPVKIGLKAIAHGTNPTAVAAADVTDWYANRAGVPFVIGGHPNILTKNLNITDADGAQIDTDIIGAIGAGVKYVVTHITVTADNANTVDVAVRIGFGTVNTPGVDAAGVILAHSGIPAGSGVSIGNGAGIVGVGGDGAELRVTCEDPINGAIDIVVGYYTIES